MGNDFPDSFSISDKNSSEISLKILLLKLKKREAPKQQVMTEKDLVRFIDDLNNALADEYIFTRPLTSTVDFAIVCDYVINPMTKVKCVFDPLRFYFIKNSNNNYVAAVCDMSSDLHWVVHPQYRGNSPLKFALKETILPHLFQDNRWEQRITVNRKEIGEENYSASVKIAKSLCFIETSNENDKTEMKILSSTFNEVGYFDGHNTIMPEKRINVLKDRAGEITKELLKIKSELEMKRGFRDEIDDFDEIVKSVKNIPALIHDAYYST